MANSEQPVQDQGPKRIVLGQGSIELSKQLIGCGGGIATALITGVFLLIANSGIMNRIIPATPTNTVIVTSVNTVTIAAVSTATPTPTVSAGSIGPITFAAGTSGVYGTEPVEASTRFPQGVTRVYAIFSYENINLNTPWRSDLLYNDKLYSSIAGLWQRTPSGTTNFWQLIPNGFPAGQWEWRLYLDDVLAQKERFSVVAQPTGSPYFSTIQFADDFNAGEPVNPYIYGYYLFSSGTTKVTAYFRAVNMVAGAKCESRWYFNGDPIPDANEAFTWNDVSNPIHYNRAVLENPQGLSAGTYTLKLTIDSKVVQLTTFMVLSPIATLPATSTPQATSKSGKPGNAEYGNITFAAGIANGKDAIEPSSTFPQSITQIVAIYQYKLDLNSKWREDWFLNDKLYSTYGGVWKGDTAGIAKSWMSAIPGLPTGKWVLKTYVEDTLIQSGTFTILEMQPNQANFGAVTFAEGIKDNEPVNPHGPRDPFALETIQIVAFFPSFNILDDTVWTEEWYLDGVKQTSVEYKGPQSADASRLYTARINSIQRLPAGTYTLKLLIGDRVSQIATFVIGP
jgi:hypothetical protein